MSCVWHTFSSMEEPQSTTGWKYHPHRTLSGEIAHLSGATLQAARLPTAEHIEVQSPVIGLSSMRFHGGLLQSNASVGRATHAVSGAGIT